jgi:hypothetical protein
MHWIPVGNQLPDDDIVVLTYTPTHSEPVWLSYYDGETWHYAEGDRHTPSHWAELPEPPQELHHADQIMDAVSEVRCALHRVSLPATRTEERQTTPTR